MGYRNGNKAFSCFLACLLLCVCVRTCEGIVLKKEIYHRDMSVYYGVGEKLGRLVYRV